MTIIEIINTHNEARFELAEVLVQTFEDIDTYEHLLRALLADSQNLTRQKHQFWYMQLQLYFQNIAHLPRAQQLEIKINRHLLTLAQCQAGSPTWLTCSQQLLSALNSLNACDVALTHTAKLTIKDEQLEAWGKQFQKACQQALHAAFVA